MARKGNLLSVRQETWERDENQKKQKPNIPKLKEKPKIPDKAITREKKQELKRQVMNFMQSTDAPLGGTGAAYAREAQKQGRLTKDAENTLRAVQKEQEKAREKREQRRTKDEIQPEDTERVKSYLERVSPQSTGSSYGAMGQLREGTPQNKPKEDRKQTGAEAEEKVTKAVRGYEAEQKRRQEEDSILRADMAELDSWPERDRAALKTYIIERGREADPTSGFGFGTARANAAELFNKYGAKKIKELAESYGRWENERNAQEIAAAGASAAESGGFADTLGTIGANIASVGANIAGAVTGTAGYLNEMTRRTGRYATLDPNNEGNVFGTWAGAVRQKTAEDIEQGATGKVGSTIYQGAMSAVDSLTRALIAGPAGAATLAASDSFARNVSQASGQGASPMQAVTLGIANAGIEYLTEKIPLDNLFKAAKGGTKGAAAFIKGILTQGGLEAATEELSLLGSIAAEAAILGDKDSTRQRIGELVANGASYQDAKEQVNRELWAEAANTFAVSFVSGGLGAGAGQILGNLAGTQPEAAQPVQQTVAAEKTPQQRLMETMAPIAQQAPHAAQTEQEARAAEATKAMLTGIVPGKTVEAASPQVADMQKQSPEGGQPMVEQAAQEGAAVPQMEYDLGIKGTGATDTGVNDAAKPEYSPGIKGTGAAEVGFTGLTDFYALLGDDNAQPDRATDVRPMEMIRRDAQGKRVSDTAGNLYGAKVTSDEMASELQKLSVTGAFSFDTKSNKEAMSKAANEIQKMGWDSTARDITSRTTSGQPKDGDIEKAILLYSHYVSKGDLDSASGMAVDLAALGNKAGRDLQMFKMLRQMTPEGQLMTVEKTVQRTMENMKKTGRVKNDYDPGDIDPELKQDYLEAAKEAKQADTQEKQKKAEQKQKDIQDKILAAEAAKMPATIKAKWDAWRYMAMLGNVKTQIRNIFGNVLFAPYKSVKDNMAAAAEKIFLPKDQRTKAVLNIASEEDRKLLSWAKADAKSEAVKDALRYSAKLGDDVSAAKMRDNAKVFDSKTLETVRKFVESVPQMGDMWFKNPHYTSSLAGFLKARGYTAQQITDGSVSESVLAEARSYAIQEAMKATFNDSNAFSDTISSLRFKEDTALGKVLNIMVEGVLPFRRTPANIIVRFSEYSPVGLAKGAWDAAVNVKNGKMSAAAAIDELASGLTGTAAMALGYLMAKGICGVKLTGSNATDEEKRRGHQDYALEFSIDGQEYSYKIDWAAPANMPLFLGANIYERMQGKGQDEGLSALTNFIYSLGNMFEPVLALSCLSGLNDVVESAKYSEDGTALYTLAVEAATGYFTQGIPAFLRQGWQASQETKQTTFANDPDPLIRDIQRKAANVPILGGKYQTEKINAWGEEESNGSAAWRAFNAFINPGTGRTIDNRQLEQEIERLAEKNDGVTPPTTAKTVTYTDKDGERHQNRRLTEEEYQTLATTQGQTAKKILQDAIESPVYAAMTDAQKAKVFEYAYDYAREKGRTEALEGYDGMSAWMQGIDGKELKTILDKVTTAAISDAIGADDEGGLAEAYKSYSAMTRPQRANFIKKAQGRTADYLEAKEAGMKDKTWLSLYRQYKKIDGGDKTTTEKANEWALKLEQAEKNGTITEAQKNLLKGNMSFNYSMTAETEKFDKMVESGVKAETAFNVGKLLAGIKPQEGYETVRDVQKYEAIADSKYTDAEKDLIMKAYMPDYDPTDKTPDKTELKYDAIRDLGYSPEEYVDIYQAYSDSSKKAEKIAAIQKLGYNYSQAALFYSIFYGSYFKGK